MSHNITVRRVARAAGVASSLVGVALLTPAQAQAESALSCSASVSSHHPSDDSTVKVTVHSKARVRVKAVAHYKTTSTGHVRTADKHGNAVIPFDISRATPGYKVTVSVTVTGKHHSSSCSTAFTPR